MHLETERLILRPLTQDDVDAIHSVIGDPVAMQYYPRLYAREDAVEWIERNRGWYERDGYSLLAVVLKITGKVIGDCGLSWQLADETPMLELGYHFQRDHWDTAMPRKQRERAWNMRSASCPPKSWCR